MSDTRTLCPVCLTELPADYPYDHVAIDRALAGDQAVYRAMDVNERRELVRYARTTLKLSDTAIGRRICRNTISLQRLLTVGLRDKSTAQQLADLDKRVRPLWEQGLSDGAIGAQLGVPYAAVRRSRHRQQLPGVAGMGGRPHKELTPA